MSYSPLQNALQGIQHAQEGRTNEALAYLREAVQREPVNAEVWLWLAHVTPDIREYQNCIHQALRLSPNHMMARQMQDALMQHQFNTSQFHPAMMYPPQPGTKQKPAWRRVLILAGVGLIIGSMAAGVVIFLINGSLG